MKNLFVFFAILGFFLVTSCASTPEGSQTTTYVTLSDPGNVLDGVTAIDLTVSSVRIHNQDVDNWVTLTQEEQTFDLLELQKDDVKALLAETNLSPGTYNQVRFEVASVMVIYQGEEQEAKLPSNELKINIDFEVTNETALLDFDFLANESLHLTGNNHLIMAPVLNVGTYHGVEIEQQGNTLRIRNRERAHIEQHGMDVEGNVVKGNKIGKEVELEIGAEGNVKKKGSVSDNSPQNDEDDDASGTDNGAEGNQQTDNTNQGQNPAGQATGNFDLLVSDLPADIGDFDYLRVTFSKARVFAEGEHWYERDISGKTADLTQLVGEKALPILETELDAGTYTKVELHVASVNASVNGSQANVKVPSNKLQITKGFTIVADEETRFVFDINVVKKGHTSEYNLLPVISESGVVGQDVDIDEVNETESCDNDTDCGENQTCVDGECEIAEEEEPVCEEDSDCEEGYSCINETCVENEPECTESSDCSSGKVCVSEACVEQEVLLLLGDTPENVTENQTVTIAWTVSVEPETSIATTAMYYDTTPHTNALGLNSTPTAAGYTMMIGEQTNVSPGSFDASLTINETTYVRAYANINGYHYWSEEATIGITRSNETNQTQA